jgi:hypothetical protein
MRTPIQTRTRTDVTEYGPLPGGQTEYLRRLEYEVLFGGETGPGKTWALVRDALGLQFKYLPLGKWAIEVPQYRGVIFRRNANHLADVIEEAQDMYLDETFGAKYSGGTKGDPGPSFRFPVRYTKGGQVHRGYSGGARIYCCHLALERDKFNHHGFEYQFVGFDELTQFILSQYLYLFSRCRSKIPNLSPRVRSSTNPIGEGLVWVRKRFIDGTPPGETRWYLADEDPDINPKGIMVPEGTKDALDRLYIPGYLEQNTYVDRGLHRASVRQMGKLYARALLEHDWYAFSGDFFKMFERKQVVKPFPIPQSWDLVGALDPGWTSPCSFSLSAIDHDRNEHRMFTYYVREKNSRQHAQAIKERIKSFPYTEGRMPSMIVAGEDAFYIGTKLEEISSEVTFEDAFEAEGMVLEHAVTDRVLGWWAVKDMMSQNKFFVWEGMNQPFLDEMAGAVHDEKDVEDIKGKGNDPNIPDHALDEQRYRDMAIWKPTRAVKDPAVKSWRTRMKKQALASVPGGGWSPGDV